MVTQTKTDGSGNRSGRNGQRDDDGIIVMPQSLEMEQCTLGAMMLDHAVIPHVTARLKAVDFYREGHRVTFGAITFLYERGDSPDIKAVACELLRRGQLDVAGGAGYLMTMMELTPAAANFAQYVDVVERKALLRALFQHTDELRSLLWSGGDDVEKVAEILAAMSEMVSNKQAGESKARLMRDILDDVYNEMDERRRLREQGQERQRGTLTGFLQLDKILLGLRPSNLAILAALPSRGKSALALNIACYAAVKCDKAVLFISLEMGDEELGERVISAETGINLMDVMRVNFGENDAECWRNVADAVDRYSQKSYFVCSAPDMTPQEMRAVAMTLRRQHELGLIVVDYIQEAKPSRPSENRNQEVSLIARELKALARVTKCPVLALSQFTREVERRQRKPRLSDLRESGTIEQAADVVMFIHHEEAEDEADRRDVRIDDKPRPVEIIIAKNRNGPKGSVMLEWMPHVVKFGNLAAQEAETHEGSYARTEY